MHCTEIPIHTKYLIYRITFPLGIILTQVNHIRYLENFKIYWEKFDSDKPPIQYFRCQAHTSSNCNKKPVCLKYAGQHDTKSCKKTPEIPPTCVDCKGEHAINYSKYPVLPGFLGKRKKTLTTWTLNTRSNSPSAVPTQNFSHLTPNRIPPLSDKLQNKTRNIVCKSTSITPSVSTNWILD